MWSAHVHATTLSHSCQQIIQQQKASEAENEEETDTLLAFVALGGNVRYVSMLTREEFSILIIGYPYAVHVDLRLTCACVCRYLCICARVLVHERPGRQERRGVDREIALNLQGVLSHAGHRQVHRYAYPFSSYPSEPHLEIFCAFRDVLTLMTLVVHCTRLLVTNIHSSHLD